MIIKLKNEVFWYEVPDGLPFYRGGDMAAPGKFHRQTSDEPDQWYLVLGDDERWYATPVEHPSVLPLLKALARCK